MSSVNVSSSDMKGMKKSSPESDMNRVASAVGQVAQELNHNMHRTSMSHQTDHAAHAMNRSHSNAPTERTTSMDSTNSTNDEDDADLSVNIPIILEVNKAIDKRKRVACKSKRRRTYTAEAKNNDETNIYSNPLQGYHLNASFLSRIWQTLHHLHSGLIFYKTIFLDAIISKKKCIQGSVIVILNA